MPQLQRWLRTTFCRQNWHWLTLNGVALATLVYVLSHDIPTWQKMAETFDPMLESGKWGIRWLLVCLAMTPLHTYLRWQRALKVRKAAGLWAFVFGAAHFGLYAAETWEPAPSFRTNGLPWHWLAWPMQHYILLGLVSLLILTALALTSNRWAMRQLGKQWKRLHRLVYGVGVAMIAHALLASTMSKKMMVRDPHAVMEMQIYLGVLAVLLLIRVPQVRTRLLRVLKRTPRVAQPPPVVVISPHLPRHPAPTLPTWPTHLGTPASAVVEEDSAQAISARERVREPA